MNQQEQDSENRAECLTLSNVIENETLNEYHLILNDKLDSIKNILLNDYSEASYSEIIINDNIFRLDEERRIGKSGRGIGVGEVLKIFKTLKGIDSGDIEPEEMELRCIPKKYLEINEDLTRNKMSISAYALRLYAFEDFERVCLGGDDSDEEEEDEEDEEEERGSTGSEEEEERETDEQRAERIRWERLKEPIRADTPFSSWDYTALYTFSRVGDKKFINFYFNHDTRCGMLRGTLGDVIGDIDDGAECLWGVYNILGRYIENIARQFNELRRYIEREEMSINFIIMTDKPKAGKSSDSACEFLGCEFYELMPLFDTMKPKNGEEPEIWSVYDGKFKDRLEYHGIECGADFFKERNEAESERVCILLCDIHLEALKSYNPYKNDLKKFFNIINNHLYFNTNINIIYHKNPDFLRFPRCIPFWERYSTLFKNYMIRMEEELYGGCARSYGLFFSHSHFLYSINEKRASNCGYLLQNGGALKVSKYIKNLYEGLRTIKEDDETPAEKEIRREMRFVKNRALELLKDYNKYIKKAYFYKKINFYLEWREISRELNHIIEETKEKIGTFNLLYIENLFYAYELIKELKKLDRYK